MKKIHLSRIIIFLTILIIPLIFINFKPNQVSTIDNRNLTEFSEITNKNFTKATESYLNDRIGFRNTFINAYNISMDRIFNHMVHPSYTYGQHGYVFPKLSPEVFNKEYQEVFSDFILKLQTYCNSKDIDFLYTVEPSKLTVYPEFLPIGFNYTNLNLNYFLELLKEKNINHLYTGDALINSKKDSQVFNIKYDANHWNETGAIIGISEILNRLNNMNPLIDKFDETKYEKSSIVNSTLPVSYFPINEETDVFNLIENNATSIDTYVDKIKISSQHKSFRHYKNPNNSTAPKILVFAGSYFNGKDKFLTESFSEYTLVHSYENVLNIDYYINIFQPDIILFESTEYTHNSRYFNMNSMENIQYNKDISSYKNLMLSDFTKINGDISITNNGVVVDYSIPLSDSNTGDSYALIGDTIIDCRTITTENNNQFIEFSIPTTLISNTNNISIYLLSKDEKEYTSFNIDTNL